MTITDNIEFSKEDKEKVIGQLLEENKISREDIEKILGYKGNFNNDN